MADNAEALGMQMQGGFLQPLPPNPSNDQIAVVMNDIINRMNDQLRTQVFTDGTTKRMLIGYQKDGWGTGKDFGIKVSLEGVDVTTAEDDELLFRMALDNWQWRSSDGKLVREFDIENGFEAWYDKSGIDYQRTGTLPDDTGGTITAKPGYSVKNDVYGS